MEKQTVSLPSNSDDPIKTNDVATQELLKELQKSIDEVKASLIKRDESASKIISSDNATTILLVDELKKSNEMLSIQLHWFVYSIILAVGVAMIFYFYRLFRKFY